MLPPLPLPEGFKAAGGPSVSSMRMRLSDFLQEHGRQLDDKGPMSLGAQARPDEWPAPKVVAAQRQGGVVRRFPKDGAWMAVSTPANREETARLAADLEKGVDVLAAPAFRPRVPACRAPRGVRTMPGHWQAEGGSSPSAAILWAAHTANEDDEWKTCGAPIGEDPEAP